MLMIIWGPTFTFIGPKVFGKIFVGELVLETGNATNEMLPGPAAASLGARSPLARRLCYPRWKLETARREQSSAEASPLCVSLGPKKMLWDTPAGEHQNSIENNNNNNNLKTPKCNVLLSS